MNKEMSQLDFKPAWGWMLVLVMVVAFMSLFLSLQAGLFLLFFSIVAWWVWENTEEGFMFLIVIAPILPMLKITQTIGTITIVKDVIILTLFARLVAWPLLMKELPYRRNILLAPIIALIGWTSVEVLRADSFILGILRSRDILLFLFLYWAVLYLEHNKKLMTTRLKWLMGSLLILLILGVYQWFWAVDSAVQRFDPVREIWIPRLSSVMAHPSIFGQYLVNMFALLGALVLTLQRWKWRVLASILMLIIPAFVFLTYSRAVWIALALVIGVFSLILVARWITRKVSKRKLFTFIGIVSLVLVIVLLGLVKFTPAGVYIRSAIDPTYGSNEERIEFAARLIAPMSNAEALFGKGLGDVLAQNFREVDLSVHDVASVDARSVQLNKNRTLVDNQYLKTFVEMGLAGLLIYGWLFWRLMNHSFMLSMRGSTIGMWGVTFLAAFIIQGLFIDIWDIFPTNMMFWIVAGLVSVELSKKKAT